MGENKIVVRVPEKVGTGVTDYCVGPCTVSLLAQAVEEAGHHWGAWWSVNLPPRFGIDTGFANDAIKDDAKRRQFCIDTLSKIPGVEVVA